MEWANRIAMYNSKMSIYSWLVSRTKNLNDSQFQFFSVVFFFLRERDSQKWWAARKRETSHRTWRILLCLFAECCYVFAALSVKFQWDMRAAGENEALFTAFLSVPKGKLVVIVVTASLLNQYLRPCIQQACYVCEPTCQQRLLCYNFEPFHAHRIKSWGDIIKLYKSCLCACVCVCVCVREREREREKRKGLVYMIEKSALLCSIRV